MRNCKKCDELLAILKDVKLLMDSDRYIDGLDSIYDRISSVVEE